jgi:hypothetical protein
MRTQKDEDERGKGRRKQASKAAIFYHLFSGTHIFCSFVSVVEQFPGVRISLMSAFSTVARRSLLNVRDLESPALRFPRGGQRSGIDLPQKWLHVESRDQPLPCFE